MKQIELYEDIPSICAFKLKSGSVDLALVPVALLSELKNYSIVSNYCIGAEGKVDSVKLYSDVPIEEISNVTLDYQSLTSITLVKILFKFYWKKTVNFLEAKPGFENEINGVNAAVIIGDRTFGINGKHPYEIDLAEAWKNFTGLPFVFAAWVTTKQLPSDFIDEFNKVLGYGIQNIPDAVRDNSAGSGLPENEILSYLTEKINYNLDTPKLKALETFLSFIEKL
jgi:chorismate dehydratase